MLKTSILRTLVVLKVPKYYSFKLDQKWGSKRLIDDVLVGFKASKDVHEAKCSEIIESMKDSGLNVDIKLFNDLNSKIKDYDLVVTLGGDGTFLRAASYIHDETPIMAINTDPSRSFCNFCSYVSLIQNDDFKHLWKRLFNGNYGILKRTRLEIGIIKGNTGDIDIENKHERHLALNEMVFAESSIARVSNFRLSVDDSKPVPYRSSGLIVSTGSGSTGILKSAMAVDPEMVKEIVWESEHKKLGDEEARKLSNKIIQKHLISGSSRDLFYFVREPIIQKDEDRNKSFRGYGKKISIQSVMENSIIAIDGRELKRLQFGEQFTLKPSTQDLFCINLSF